MTNQEINNKIEEVVNYLAEYRQFPHTITIGLINWVIKDLEELAEKIKNDKTRSN